MAVVSVSTDLTTLHDAGGNATTAETEGWSETSGTGAVSGHDYADIKSLEEESDAYIEAQDTGNSFQAVAGAWTTNAPQRGGIVYNTSGSPLSLGTDDAILAWMWFIAPLALEDYSVAGLSMITGSATSAFNVFPVSGNNFQPSPVGGWYCHALNPSAALTAGTDYEQVGSPTTTVNYVGGGLACLTKMSRGLTHFVIDAVRYGRCTSLVTGGTSTDANAVFSDISDELQANGSFGTFDAQGGAFFMQGKLQFGNNASTTGEVDFHDSNKVINIRNTPQVSSGFHRIEIQNGSTTASNVSFTGCTFNNIGVSDPVATTASLGDFAVIDATANLVIDTCGFNDMGDFTFGSGTTITDTAFRRCVDITTNGADLTRVLVNDLTTLDIDESTLTDCDFIDAPRINVDNTGITMIGGSITRTTDTTSMVLYAPDTANTFSGVNFIGEATNKHAVELSEIPSGGSLTWDHTFDSNFASGTAGVEGTDFTATSNGDEALYINPGTSSTAITISVSGGATTPSIRRGTGYTGTITIVGQSYNFVFTGLKDGTEIRLHRTDNGNAIAGVEDMTGGVGTDATADVTIGGTTDNNTFTYSYTYGGSAISFYAVIMNNNYIYQKIENLSLAEGGGSVPVSQQIDRNYSNP